MTDVFFVALVVAFFTMCVGYVRACDRIITPDSESADETDLESSVSSR